jgi:hypothetical protein
MASQAEIDGPPARRTGRRIGCYAALVVLAILGIALAILWANRERIADNVIADELTSLGIDATYKIERIGGRRQVLTDIVVGDPRRPDLTVERAEVIVQHRFGFPAISAVRLVRPRLYGTYRGGKLSFGALDPLIFAPREERPFELPDFALAVEGGRGLLETDYGPIGIALAGSGPLRGGFAGELAATSPQLALPGCEATRPTLYGRISVASERPGFEGPLRLARLECGKQGISLANTALQLSARADKTLTAFEGKAGLRTGRAAFGDNRLAGLTGTTEFSWREGGLTTRYKLQARNLATAQAAAARLDFNGSLRARRNFDRVELDAEFAGEGVRPGSGLDVALADAAEATGDTLLSPIFAQVRRRLAAEGRDSRLAGELTVRRTGERTSIVVPGASLRGGSGATLLALSRFQVVTGGGASPRFAGNFATGGEGLPRMAGRMEQRPGGAVQVRMTMAEYAAGSSRLAVPEMVLVQRPDGTLGFAGQVRASGALPGGRAEALLLPVSGSWSPSRGLAMWNDCTTLRFERLQLANLTLDRRNLTLCPPRGTAMVRYDGRGLRIAAGAPSLQLAGRLGETPIAIRSGGVGFAYPGALSARQLVVTLGPAATATTFAVNDLSARIGEDVAGRFEGADVRLFAVPLDLLGASGDWRYANGRLTLTGGAFQMEDRQEPDRFHPLVAEGATLALENNLITAEALMREPETGRTVTHLDIVHNLATGAGHADLVVPGLTFERGFQLARLTPLDLGVSNLRGTVTGSGRIDWNEAGVTSTGRFSSDSLDFAATFGPVQGASGTIEFTDLLGLTTAPGQRIRVASINPGIEVTDGIIEIQVRGGEVLGLQSGTFPFMGGTLTIRPLDIHFGAAEVRRYVIEIEGLDASRFVERMELNNISATGTFDGTVPIVFDAEGNGRLEDGLLISRPPGGNVSYVGELTYEDLGVVANFAFDTLRSLDYRQMRVGMEGTLTGEIVTRVRLDGVSQGAGAKRNIVTRAIAGIPIRLDVNVRAPFYQLISTTRALYDPAMIRDPRDLGLLDSEGNVIRRESNGLPPAPITPEDLIPDEPAIQRRESEESP